MISLLHADSVAGQWASPDRRTAALAVLNGTGPLLLRDALMRHLGFKRLRRGVLPPVPPSHPRLRVWPLGTWFIPCAFINASCTQEMLLRRATGHAPLDILAGRYACLLIAELCFLTSPLSIPLHLTPFVSIQECTITR